MRHNNDFTMIKSMGRVAIVGVLLPIIMLVIANRFDSQDGLESLSDTTTEQPAKPAKKRPCPW